MRERVCVKEHSNVRVNVCIVCMTDGHWLSPFASGKLKPHPLWPDYHGNLWPRGHPPTEPHAFMQPFSSETNPYKKSPTRKTLSHLKFIVSEPTKHTFNMHYCMAITIWPTGSVADVPGVKILWKWQRRRHNSQLTGVCGIALVPGRVSDSLSIH